MRLGRWAWRLGGWRVGRRCWRLYGGYSGGGIGWRGRMCRGSRALRSWGLRFRLRCSRIVWRRVWAQLFRDDGGARAAGDDRGIGADARGLADGAAGGWCAGRVRCACCCCCTTGRVGDLAGYSRACAHGAGELRVGNTYVKWKLSHVHSVPLTTLVLGDGCGVAGAVGLVPGCSRGSDWVADAAA